MSKSFNQVILLGHVGKQPEVKYSQSGTAVAKLSLATNERRKDKSGNWTDKTDWHNIVAFGKTAEVIKEYVGKGKQVQIVGKLSTSTYDKDGETRYKTEVVVNELILLGSESNAAQTKKQNNPDITDQDIPF